MNTDPPIKYVHTYVPFCEYGRISPPWQAEACARGTGTAAADCFVVVDVWVLCFSRCKFGVDEHRKGAGGVGASAAQIIAKCTL